MNKYIIKACGWDEIQALISDLLEFCLEADLKNEDVRGLIRVAQILNAAEEFEEKSSNGDCFCPFAKEHCTDGRVESKPNDECEFWNPQVGDCRFRLVLSLMEKRMKEVEAK